MFYPTGSPGAVARIRGSEEYPGLQGTVRFYQLRRHVLLEAYVEGLPSGSDTGFFAFHIHSGPSCAGEAFAETQGHYNPAEVPHPLHAGDLPPLLSCHGKAYLSVITDRFRLREVMGRTLVIHSGADDFHSQPAGAPGSKIACGVILPK